MSPQSDIEHIRAKVRMVVTDNASFGLLSSGEKIAVGLVLDRTDLVHEWGSMLEFCQSTRSGVDAGRAPRAAGGLAVMT